MPEEIIIRVEGLGKSRKEENKKELDGVNDPKKKSNKKEEEKTEKSVAGVASAMIIKQGHQLISSAVNRTVSTIGAREDNIARQNEIQNVMNMANQAVSTVNSLGSAFAATEAIAAGAGPIGLAIAAAGELISKTMEVVQNLQNYERERAIDNANSMQNIERLGNITTKRNRK